MAEGTLKGRYTAGAGDPEDLTGAQATALLDAFTGDSGSGGEKGLVPAPGAGDKRKLLSGSATWVLPAAPGRLTLTSGGSAPASVTGATSIYYTPHVGALIPFIESGNLIVDQFSEMSLAGNAAHAVNSPSRPLVCARSDMGSGPGEGGDE